LQEENDELYDILKKGETGKLKEEVRGLRRVVNRLEGALQGEPQINSTPMKHPLIRYLFSYRIPSSYRELIVVFSPHLLECYTYKSIQV
jgi:hypothetical protein